MYAVGCCVRSRGKPVPSALPRPHGNPSPPRDRETEHNRSRRITGGGARASQRSFREWNVTCGPQRARAQHLVAYSPHNRYVSLTLSSARHEPMRFPSSFSLSFFISPPIKFLLRPTPCYS